MLLYLLKVFAYGALLLFPYTFSTAGVVGLAIFHISRSRPFELKNSCSCTMSPCYTTDAFSHLVKLNTGCKPHFASSTKRVFACLYVRNTNFCLSQKSQQRFKSTPNFISMFLDLNMCNNGSVCRRLHTYKSTNRSN